MNFQDCHEEQIHIPAHIQSYGYIIGLRAADKTLQFYSENITTLFPVHPDMLGKSFESLQNIFSVIITTPIFSNTDKSPKEANKNLAKITINNLDYHLTIYKYKGYIYIELEEYLKKQIPRNRLYQGIKEVQSAKTEEEIWSALVKNIMEITRYDRVMIYKFLNDGSGKVVAEEKLPEMESYINLYYPESDIPKQARALYLINYKRIFSNVHQKPVAVKSLIPAVDMTHSTVRAMSPIHAVYIKNSGSSSSFSTSIIVDNKLWGLVTCHATLPRHIDLYNRIQAEICTLIAANAYFSLKSRIMVENESLFNQKSVELKNKLSEYDNLKESLFNNTDTILEITNTDGFAVISGNDVKTAGESPEPAVVTAIAIWARQNIQENFYANHEFFMQQQENITGLDQRACGVVITFIGKQRNTVLIWFRKEFKEHIEWAGNPEKSVDTFQFYDQKKRAISPRASFNIFIQEISGKSMYWSKKDLLEINKIHEAIVETVQLQFDKLSQLNKELNKVNEELDHFSHTISHDLASPLTVIKLNMQLMARKTEDAWARDKISFILNEIENMSKMMTDVLELSRLKHAEYPMTKVSTRSLIDKICRDAIFAHNQHTEIIVGDTPEVLGEKTLVFQIFQNVISNAVKYSSQKKQPQVKITGDIEDKCVVYRITDNGIGIPACDIDNVFKIFKRIENAQSFNGTGVGLNIVQRIMNRLEGTIQVESEVNEGSTFILKFKTPYLNNN